MTLRADGTLVAGDAVPAHNPAVIVGGRDRETVYAVSESISAPGVVTRFRVGTRGLDVAEAVQCSGRSTCGFTVAPAGDAALAVSYWDGAVDVFDLDVDGRLGACRQALIVPWTGSEAARQVDDADDHLAHRQVGPHPHGVFFWHQWAFVPDLGGDVVHQYRWRPEARCLEFEMSIGLPAGTGPRQLSVGARDTMAYVSGELNSTVLSLRLDDRDSNEVRPRATVVQIVSTSSSSINSIAELTQSPDGRFVLVANRGDDTITTLGVGDDGLLGTVSTNSTGGAVPRHFAVTPCGGAVIVANQDSDEVRVFRRDQWQGSLHPTDRVATVGCPNFVYVHGDGGPS